jgi:hypothetical protein
MEIYQGKEYSSKAAIIRDLYDSGKVSMKSDDKKRIAAELGISVPTVHATLVHHLGLATKHSKKPSTVTPAITQIQEKVNQRIVRNSSNPIFLNDKSSEVRAELMKDSRVIAITYAPNQWGMPTTNPPLLVIDDGYDPNWEPESDTIERLW